MHSEEKLNLGLINSFFYHNLNFNKITVSARWHQMSGNIFDKLSEPDFVNELVKMSSIDEIKSFLISNDEKLEEREANELSSEIFSIISGLKKMDEKQLEQIAGGLLGINPKNAIFALQGVANSANAYVEKKAAEKELDAATGEFDKKQGDTAKIDQERQNILEQRKKCEIIYGVSFAAMASLGALAILKIVRSAGHQKD